MSFIVLHCPLTEGGLKSCFVRVLHCSMALISEAQDNSRSFMLSFIMVLGAGWAPRGGLEAGGCCRGWARVMLKVLLDVWL